MARVKDKLILITGASRGIGAETARLLIKEGAMVIITDVRDELGQAIVDTLGPNAYYKHLDVSNEEQWQQVTQEIKSQFGKIDGLFNNAGITGLEGTCHQQNPEETTLEMWHRVHSICLDGVFLGCKYGIELMKEHGGSIVNMSSRSGVVGIPNVCAYASAKAAVRNHSKSVALYCAQQGYNIRSNTLLPAAIMTALWDPLLPQEQCEKERKMSEIIEGIPLKHTGKPIDVAYAALYFLSDESNYVTGSELVIDGGILAGAQSAPGKK